MNVFPVTFTSYKSFAGIVFILMATVMIIAGMVQILTEAIPDDMLWLTIKLLITTMLVGISEELMFIGIVLRVFLEKRSELVAVFVSSALFSLLHSVNILGGSTTG